MVEHIQVRQTDGAVDAFGQLIYDLHRGLLGEDAREVLEREDGFIGAFVFQWYFAPFEKWFLHEQKAMEYVRGRTLDVGCGAGRVALHLQEKGLNVVGIDNSPLAIKTCEERGVKDARLLSITQASANKLGVFDSIVMMGNNFGLFGSLERARWLLRRFYRMTTARGRIVAETGAPFGRADDPIHLAYEERNRALGRMSGQRRGRIRYRNLKGPWFDYLYVSRDEMREIVDGTGWVVREFIDSEGGNYVGVIEKA